MKMYVVLFFILGISLSCKKNFTEFLEKPPGVDVTIDTIFSSERQIETFVASLYYYGLPAPTMPNWDNNRARIDGTIAGATDEAETVMTWYWSNRWNVGDFSPSSIIDLNYNNRWRVIRMANIIIENIDNSPVSNPNFKNRVKGEAYFMRAFSYLEMFQRYGGVPIVDKVLDVNDDLHIPRSSVEQTVDFIVNDADLAASLLPDSYPSNQRGHAPKGAPLMVKSRALLYAASPQFNTSSPPLSLGNDNSLICYGNYDQNRWQLAADAAKAVIDWAKTSEWCALVTDKGPSENHFYLYEYPDNSEVILAKKELNVIWTAQGQTWKSILPSALGGPGGTGVTLNFIKKYEKKDGTPQIWNMNGGNNLQQLYNELDPRFGQACAYNLSFWNEDFPYMELWRGGKHSADNITGVFLRWPLPRQQRTSAGQIPNEIQFRLGEAFVNYAEALNEAKGPVSEAYVAINTIRNRSGMPNLPSNLTKEEFRERARNERTIELAFEGQRLWDVRRWLIAINEGVMRGDMWGIKIERNADNSFSYEPYVFERRIFEAKMYLEPFPQSEVNKGYLVQNPGY